MLGSLIAEGRTSCVYEYGPGHAVKVLNADVPMHWADVEAAFTRQVRSVGVRAPDVVDVIALDGRPALIVERIDGPSMWQIMRDRPADVEAVMTDFAAVQRAILGAGIPDGLPNAIDRIRRKIVDAGHLRAEDEAEVDAMVDSFPIGAATLHGDLHPGNVLVAAGEPVVIDWFDAAVGHPVLDVIRTSLLIRPLRSTDVMHLPGCDLELLERMHRAYSASVEDVVAPYVDQLGEWEAASAMSRLSEGSDADPADLQQMWTERAGPLSRRSARSEA